MVCDRCIKIVHGLLINEGYTVISIELGKVLIKTDSKLHSENIAILLAK